MNAYSRELRQAESTWANFLVHTPTVYGRIPPKGSRIITVGSGCALPIARLAALTMGSRNDSLVRTCTPYEVVHSALSPDLACLISAKGDHEHILRCYETLAERHIHTIIVTTKQSSPLIDFAMKHLDTTMVICSEYQVPSGGFIPVESTLLLACLITALPSAAPLEMTAGEGIFKSARLDHENAASSLREPMRETIFNIVCSNWGSPGALDFQTRMAESGFASTVCTDPWNFAHGRYMPFVTCAERQFPISVFVAGEAPAFERIKLSPLGRAFHLCALSAPISGFWGAVYCILRSMLMVELIVGALGIDPATPEIPGWGNALYNGEGEYSA